MQNEALRQAQLTLEASRDRYVDLYEFAPVGYLTVSRNGVLVAINLTGARLLGIERGRLIGKRFARQIDGPDQDRWQRHFALALRRSDRSCIELMLRRQAQPAFPAALECAPGLDDHGEPTLRISVTDISERRALDEERRIAAIAFESQDGIMITDAKSVILRVNQAFTRMTGYSDRDVIGSTPAILKSGRHDAAFYQRLWDALRSRGSWQGEIWNRRKNGEIYVERITISAVANADGKVTHYVSACSDVTNVLAAEAEIYQLAYYDPLTRLPNRRLLHDRMLQALAASARNGHCGALLFLDLDNFKSLNDSRGHDVGDQLLIEAARRIQAQLRQSDTVARQGGDEFLVMLQELSTETEEAAVQSRAIGEKIRMVLAQPYDLGGREFYSSASFGVALFGGGPDSAETLLRHADLAMYQAKRAGGNRVQFFDPEMQTVLDQRSALEADLRLALERAQLQLYFQPQFDLAGQMVGAEALLRWAHHSRGLVLPDAFIALAEDTGLILPIGRWVIACACAHLAAWSTQPALAGIRLAVNVSARQFCEPDFVDQVRQTLVDSGANPQLLEFELTESEAVDNVADTVARMRALKLLGICFAMDDFGTGFSSLAYLKRLPLDELKIDAAFVRDLSHDANDAAIVQTIIAMGKILGLRVIAEGVETAEQLQLLTDNGCQLFQGYWFSHPLALVDFETFARARSVPIGEGGAVLAETASALDTSQLHHQQSLV